MILHLAHGEGDGDQRFEAYPAGRLGNDLIYSDAVLKRYFDRLAQVTVETDSALSFVLGKRSRHFGERRFAGVAANLDDVVDGEVRLRHDRRIEKGEALAIVFGKTVVDGQ